MAAYIDLNCVRAELVTDPKDYRFCGYAEAVAGRSAAQTGLRAVTGDHTWVETQAHYREVLFGTGAGVKEAAATIPTADLESVIAEGGKLPLLQPTAGSVNSEMHPRLRSADQECAWKIQGRAFEGSCIRRCRPPSFA